MNAVPSTLAEGLDRLAGEFGVRRLTAHVQRLRDDYRASDPGRPNTARAGRGMTREEAGAYAVYRMPATYAAARAVLAELAAADPAFRPRTLLDVGAGSGAASWAALDAFPSLETVALLDRDPAMIDVGRALAATAESAVLRGAAWHTADLADATTPWPTVDLAIVGYALNELDQSTVDDVVDRLTAAAAVVAIVEPGTPRGFAVVRGARDRIIRAGHRVAAPCPHDEACPMAGGDWCHMSARLPRSGAHRRAKGGTLGYEDEKFAYAVGSTRPVEPAAGRVLRHPQVRSGHVALRVCTRADGLRDVVLARRHGAQYKAARRAVWGAPWPPREFGSGGGTPASDDGGHGGGSAPRDPPPRAG